MTVWHPDRKRTVKLLHGTVVMLLLLSLLLLLLPLSITLHALHGRSLLPADAVKAEYCNGIQYWYRPCGHLTSTEDVLLAYYTIFDMGDKSKRKLDDTTMYIDFGCGVGSTLLLVSRYVTAVGVEAQTVSYNLLRRTLEDNKLEDRVKIFNCDLRDIARGSVCSELFEPNMYDYITANPPFISPGKGTLPKDEQRKFARFELRGNIVDYFKAASSLLKENGTLLVAFPSHESARLAEAALSTGLKCMRRLDVRGSGNSNSIYEVQHIDNEKSNKREEVYLLDISRDQTTKRLSKNYVAIQDALGMKPRPLRGGIHKGVTALPLAHPAVVAHPPLPLL